MSSPAPRPSPGEPAKVALSARGRVLLIAFLLLFSAVLLEGGFRAWLAVAGKAQSPAAIRDEARLLLSRVIDTLPISDAGDTAAKHHKMPLTVHPYAGFTQEDSILRMPGELTEMAEDAAPYRVLLLGGSVAAGFGNIGAKEMAARMARSPALAGRPVEIVNHACPGHKQPQQASLLTFLLSIGYRPDLVLNLDGHNEVAIGFTNFRQGAFPPYPSGSHWASTMPSGTHFAGVAEMAALREKAAALHESFSSGATTWSAVIGHLMLARAQRVVSAYASWADAYARSMKEDDAGRMLLGPEWEADDEQGAALLVGVWREASRSMDAMCRARGIRYVHALQPTLHDEGAKPATEEELRLGATSEAWRTGVALGYPRMREAGAELAAGGVAFVDLTRVFADEARTLYVDACHFNREGSDILGRALGDAIVGILAAD